VLGVFILTLAYFSWREGLWTADAAPVARAVPDQAVAPAPHPAPVPEPAATPAATAVAAPEPASADDTNAPERRDRAARHGARTR